MKIHRKAHEPPRAALTWDKRWKGADQGLIACWERGREKSGEDPTLASQAREGRLVLLPWRGGVEKATKKKQKYGTLNYLAMWQGLRGEDLDIDTDAEASLVCTVTEMTVIFTKDVSKFTEDADA